MNEEIIQDAIEEIMYCSCCADNTVHGKTPTNKRGEWNVWCLTCKAQNGFRYAYSTPEWIREWEWDQHNTKVAETPTPDNENGTFNYEIDGQTRTTRRFTWDD